LTLNINELLFIIYLNDDLIIMLTDYLLYLNMSNLLIMVNMMLLYQWLNFYYMII